MVKYSVCGKEFERELLKTWRFRNWIVNYYICANCKKVFKMYADSKGKRKTWIIPEAKVARL